MERKKAGWRKKLFKIYLIWSGVFVVALVVVALIESRKAGTDATSWLTGAPYPDSSYPWRHAALPGVPGHGGALQVELDGGLHLF